MALLGLHPGAGAAGATRRGPLGTTWRHRGLDANARTVVLDGISLSYDWLSISTGPTHSRRWLQTNHARRACAGLFVRPIKRFVALWPPGRRQRVMKPLRLAVIGGGGAGIELALAARTAAAVSHYAGLRQWPTGRSTQPRTQQRCLPPRCAGAASPYYRRCPKLADGVVQLGCGATLACDVP